MMTKLNNLPSQFRKISMKNKLENICLKNDIVYMGIFGSFIRKEQTQKSDIDLIIKYDKSKQKSLLDLIHTENELSKMFKRKVDLLTPDSISPYLRNDILNSMKVIYEK